MNIEEKITQLCIAHERLTGEVLAMRKDLSRLTPVNCENHRIRIETLEKDSHDQGKRRWVLGTGILLSLFGGILSWVARWF